MQHDYSGTKHLYNMIIVVPNKTPATVNVQHDHSGTEHNTCTT